jgi:phenylacetate-CoA ligase
LRNIGETFYLAFPALRNIAATVKGIQLNRLRYVKHYGKTVNDILNRKGWSSDQFTAYQNKRLRKIIGTAVCHTPYYRDLFATLGLSSQDVSTANDLRKLPILEKSLVRSDPWQFVDERIKKSHLLKETTTGTTGTPTTVLLTERVQQEHYAFYEVRCRREAGLRYGQDSYVMFGARRVAPLERCDPPFWCYNYAGKQLYMSVFHLAPQYLRYYCDELSQRSYRALMGYPSAISTVAQYVIDRGIRSIKIPLAITSGETLHQHQRTAIKSAFGCRVFDQYGCAELSVFAVEGQCGRMHVSSDYGIVEIVDDAGDPVPPGEVGHLVCTGLINDAQVLLRYRTGDMGSWEINSCKCGSALPVLASVEGRSTDALLLRDGRKVFRVGTIAERIACIKEYQIIQGDIGLFTLNVVVSEPLQDFESKELIENLQAHVGRASVRINQVHALERGQGGKISFIKSKVPREII